MNCKEIIDQIEAVYPKTAACGWDNVGLLVGRKQKNVEKIFVAVDLTDDILEQAIQQQADMIITHHPLIFSPLKQITDEEFIGKRVVRLLQNDISYYAMHTNYDVLGMAQLSADYMGLQDTEVLEVTEKESNQGIGRVGSLVCDMTLEECASLVKEKFGLTHVILYGEKEKRVRRVAISPGSGKSMVEIALKKQAEVLITGDIDHHTGIDAVARGLTVIDAGHYGLEHIFIEDMVGFLEQRFEKIVVEGARLQPPFVIL